MGAADVPETVFAAGPRTAPEASKVSRHERAAGIAIAIPLFFNFISSWVVVPYVVVLNTGETFQSLCRIQLRRSSGGPNRNVMPR